MTRFLIRRVLLGILILFLVSVVVFAATHLQVLMPYSSVESVAMNW